ncbi:unnamed protein product [Lampetra planeri]
MGRLLNGFVVAASHSTPRCQSPSRVDWSTLLGPRPRGNVVGSGGSVRTWWLVSGRVAPSSVAPAAASSSTPAALPVLRHLWAGAQTQQRKGLEAIVRDVS